jgi:O-antigen/teichoic acid export membrane protein
MKKFAVFALAVTFCAPAFAYLDPGSGSAILSAVIGAFVALGMAIKSYWYKIKGLFTGKQRKKAEPAETDSKR